MYIVPQMSSPMPKYDPALEFDDIMSEAGVRLHELQIAARCWATRAWHHRCTTRPIFQRPQALLVASNHIQVLLSKKALHFQLRALDSCSCLQSYPHG